MIPTHYLSVLRTVFTRLEATPISWVITGSLGMALQGVPVTVNDLDIQTDASGAYAIEQHFAEYVIKPVQYMPSERIRSHFGILEIDGIKVEIMGDLQKRLKDQDWEEPVNVECYKEWVKIDGMQLPVLSLAYEYQAYLTLGRREKVSLLHTWFQKKFE